MSDVEARKSRRLPNVSTPRRILYANIRAISLDLAEHSRLHSSLIDIRSI